MVGSVWLYPMLDFISLPTFTPLSQQRGEFFLSAPRGCLQSAKILSLPAQNEILQQSMFTEKDIEAFSQRGISSQDVENQLNNFRNGFPFLNLRCAASPAKGIVQLTDEQRAEYHTAWQHYLQTGKTVYKFVPASGAASRMFKNLFEFLEADYSVPTTDFERTFFQNIRSFAFFCRFGCGLPPQPSKRSGRTHASRRIQSGGEQPASAPRAKLRQSFQRIAQIPQVR